MIFYFLLRLGASVASLVYVSDGESMDHVQATDDSATTYYLPEGVEPEPVYQDGYVIGSGSLTGSSSTIDEKKKGAAGVTVADHGEGEGDEEGKPLLVDVEAGLAMGGQGQGQAQAQAQLASGVKQVQESVAIDVHTSVGQGATLRIPTAAGAALPGDAEFLTDITGELSGRHGKDVLGIVPHRDYCRLAVNFFVLIVIPGVIYIWATGYYSITNTSNDWLQLPRPGTTYPTVYIHYLDLENRI